MSYTNKLSVLPYKLFDGFFILLAYIVSGLIMGWISSMFYNILNGGHNVDKNSEFKKDAKEIIVIILTIIMLQILASSLFYYINNLDSIFFNYKLDKYGYVIILYTMIWALYHPQFKKNTETLLHKYLWQPKNYKLGIILSLVLTAFIFISTIL